MKRAIAEKWVKALRSKKYKQGTGALKTKSKRGVVRHCCLGVLCELYQKTHDIKLETKAREARTPGLTVFSFGSGPDSETLLPSRVMRWAGIKDDSGIFYSCEDRDTTALAEINDDGATFREIADIIEQNVAAL